MWYRFEAAATWKARRKTARLKTKPEVRYGCTDDPEVAYAALGWVNVRLNGEYEYSCEPLTGAQMGKELIDSLDEADLWFDHDTTCNDLKRLHDEIMRERREESADRPPFGDWYGA